MDVAVKPTIKLGWRRHLHTEVTRHLINPNPCMSYATTLFFSALLYSVGSILNLSLNEREK